ncbi:MAG: DUF5658 family protein [Steroidobacteraceae bacterium]
MKSNAAAAKGDRRLRSDRRQRVIYGLLVGSVHRRRRAVRRTRNRGFIAVDWHDARWLAVAILVMLCSLADALLTLNLIHHGAYEANPVMLPLVAGSGTAFAICKLAMTGGGMVLLILLAHSHVFGWLRVANVLYGILTLYAALIGYELWLLGLLTQQT